MDAELVEVAGEGTPVVYVPGIDGTGELLLETGPELARHFRLIRLRYRAERPMPDGGDRYEDLAAAVARAIASYGEQRAILLAESFGGAVALQTALDHPDRVSALLVVNSFAHFGARVRLAFSRWTAPLVPDFLFQVGRKTLAPWALYGPREASASFRKFQDLGGVAFDDGYCRRLEMIRGLDLRDRLGEIHQPTALYAADKDRVVQSVRAMRLMAERMPDATLEILPGSGHLVLPLLDEPWVARIHALADRV